MAGQTNAVELTVRVRNEASTGLDRLTSDLEHSHRGVGRFAEAIRSLNPELAGTLETINRFVFATRNMSTGAQLMAVGIGSAAAAFAAYAVALSASIEKQLAFQAALRSWDAGQLRGQIAGATAELDRMDATLSKLGQNQGWGQAFRNIVGLITQAPTALSELAGFSQTPEARRTESISRFNTLATIQGRGTATEINAATIAQIISRLTGEQGFAAQGSQFLSYEAIGRQIEAQAIAKRDAELEAQRIAYELAKAQRPADQSMADLTQPYLARRQGIMEQFRTGASARALTARTFSGQIFEHLYGNYLPEETMGLEQITDPTLSLEARGAIAGGREGIIQRDIQRSIEESTKGFELQLGGGAEAAGVGPTAAETAKGIQDYIKRATEARDIDRERAEILGTFAGFTKDETDAIQKQVIELTRQRDIEAAAGDARKEALADFRAGIAQANLELQRMQRTDPISGLAKGFKDLARDSGEVMQDFARNLGRTMTQQLDDTFFAVVTGKFKNLGQNIAASLLRSVTSASAELLTAPLFRALGGYRSLVAVPTAGGVMLVPEGAAAGIPGVAGYSAGVGTVAAVPGSGNGIIDLATSGLTSILQSLGYSGFGVAGGAGAAELASIVAQGSAYAQVSGGELALGANAIGPAAGGVGLGTVLSGVGAGVGFLASLYAAYQTRSTGYGAASGAVGGLVAGASIGTLISPGYGTLVGGVVGLIAGAALGAGAGSLGGKNAPGGTAGERVSRKLQHAAEIARQYAYALDHAATGAELVEVLNHGWSPGPLGELIIRAVASDGSERDPRWGQYFTYADLFDPAIQASIDVSVGQPGGTRTNPDITQGTRDKIQQIAQAEGGILAAHRETGPGLTRTTYTPFGAAIRGFGGFDIGKDFTVSSGSGFFFSTEAALNQGASKVSIAGILRALVGVNTQLDIVHDLTAEQFLQL